MKSILFSLLFLLATAQLLAQHLTQNDFLGSWKVKDCQILPEMNIAKDERGKEMMKQMQQGWIGTIFNFKKNGEFTIQFKETIPEFMKELEFVNNSKWRIEDSKMITIGKEEDGYGLMNLMVGFKEGKKFFIITESPFILEVAEQ